MPTASKPIRKRLSVLDRKIAIDALPVDDREKLVVAIRRYLGDRSPDVRSWALRVASKECLWELETRVRELLDDKQGHVRHEAVECIGEIYAGDRVEVPWLYPFLQDPYGRVRVETLESPACIGDKKALPMIVECLRDRDGLVRSYAVKMIAELKGKKYRRRIELAAEGGNGRKGKARVCESTVLCLAIGANLKSRLHCSPLRPTSQDVPPPMH